MENRIISEINRVNKLMGTQTLIVEQTIAIALKNFVSKLGDDGLRIVIKDATPEIDDIVRKIKASARLSDVEVALFIRSISRSKLANYLVNNGLLGSKFSERFASYLSKVKANPNNYNAYINDLYEIIDANPIFSDMPTELLDGVKKGIKDNFDSAMKSSTSSTQKTTGQFGDLTGTRKPGAASSALSPEETISALRRDYPQFLKDEALINTYLEGSSDRVKNLVKLKWQPNMNIEAAIKEVNDYIAKNGIEKLGRFGKILKAVIDNRKYILGGAVTFAFITLAILIIRGTIAVNEVSNKMIDKFRDTFGLGSSKDKDNSQEKTDKPKKTIDNY